jgi:hypothetical protein
MTAPTEKAVSDGGHCPASETASRIHRLSSSPTRAPYPPAAQAPGEARPGRDSFKAQLACTRVREPLAWNAPAGDAIAGDALDGEAR